MRVGKPSIFIWEATADETVGKAQDVNRADNRVTVQNHIGQAIPEGEYRLSQAMDDALRAASGALPRGSDGLAHPAFAFVAALGGMGLDIKTVCARLGLPFDTGAVLGRCRIAFDRPMLVDHAYGVHARIVSLIRKSSRRFGGADHLCLATDIRVGTTHFATVELTMIVPVASGTAE
ncbi:hypothetical protein [Polymorphobacter sp.]|uniref:hypothetical protein n=1 Tax=Polymorphobacter sp. TaxID=1909290 RepID=UPI003F721086